jgi:hypothetical protein
MSNEKTTETPAKTLPIGNIHNMETLTCILKLAVALFGYAA